MRIMRNLLAVVVLLAAATVSQPQPVEAWQQSGCGFYQQACQAAPGQFFEGPNVDCGNGWMEVGCCTLAGCSATFCCNAVSGGCANEPIEWPTDDCDECPAGGPCT